MKKATILIVDDEENIVRSLSRTLRDQFTVLTATSGEAALDILTREDVAVILTDQRMPGITGVELLAQAKQYHPNTVGVLISGYSDVTALVDALNLGVVRGFIPKPWDTEDLRHKLSAAVQQFEAIFNDTAVLHNSAAAVNQARAQLAELQKVFDLITTGEMSTLLSAAEGEPAGRSLLTGQQFNREYLEHLADGFALVRATGKVDYWNTAGRRLLAACESATYEDVFGIPQLMNCRLFSEAVRSALAGYPAHTEFFLTDPQGDEYALEVAATPVPGNGEGSNAVLVIRDQTQRLQTLSHLKGLNDVAAAFGQPMDLDARLQLTLAACRVAAHADGACIYRLDANTATLQLAGAIGMGQETLAYLEQHPVKVGWGAVGQVAAAGRARADLRLSYTGLVQCDHAEHEDRISAVLAPVSDPGGVSGVIGVFTRTLRRFSEADIDLLLSIGSQVGLALHNTRLLRQLEEQARTDPLTGLSNRRHFMALAAHEYERARRHRTSLVVMMLDMVRFKQLNDSYGHAVGDQALQAAAHGLAVSIRAIDLICRYGGDEFAIVLPDCPEAEAQQIIRRLKERVSALQISTDQGTIALDVSIGWAAATFEEAESLDALLVRADASMYAAKSRVALENDRTLPSP